MENRRPRDDNQEGRFARARDDNQVASRREQRIPGREKCDLVMTSPTGCGDDLVMRGMMVIPLKRRLGRTNRNSLKGCHHERSEGSAFVVSTTAVRGSMGLPHSAERSSHVGLSRSIRATRLARSSPLICFSRRMELPMY